MKEWLYLFKISHRYYKWLMIRHPLMAHYEREKLYRNSKCFQNAIKGLGGK